jgi:ribosomal protein S18 acetylase RimI-like enzyme
MRSEDWRVLDAAAIAPLLASEADAYRTRLSWDVAEAWSVIEPARASGQLPGIVMTDARGRRAGWACFLRHGPTIQIAMFVSSSAAVTEQLLAAIEGSDAAQGATTAGLCLPDNAPGLRDALRQRGYEVSTYRYLSASLASVPAVQPDPGIDGWRIDDLTEMAALAARAYARSRDVRAFAPAGTTDEWREYIATLVTGPGCGRLRSGASFVVRRGTVLGAAVLTTELAAGTAHIAQIVVDPSMQGEGWGRRLAGAAMAAAAAAGDREMTLLVAATNHRAGALYGSLGFEDRAAFVSAVRRQPRRSTRVALATGGASTRL